MKAEHFGMYQHEILGAESANVSSSYLCSMVFENTAAAIGYFYLWL